jgi:hypothetical protein
MDMEVEEADHWISFRRGCRLYDDNFATCAGRNFIAAINVLCHDKSSDSDDSSCFGRTDGAIVQRLPTLHVYIYTFDDKSAYGIGAMHIPGMKRVPDGLPPLRVVASSVSSSFPKRRVLCRFDSY